MVTLRTLAYQYLDTISGGGMTNDSRVDERDVIINIRQLMSEVLSLNYFQKYQEGDRSAVALYISTYKIQPDFDKELKQCVVSIPELYMSLPYNRGIHRAYFIDKPYKDFVIQHNPGVSSNLPAGKVSGVNYCHFKGFTMVIRNVNQEPGTTLPKVVLELIIPAPESIGVNDPLPIIPEQQAEILRRLRAEFQPIPQDLLNNGNKDI